MQLISSVDICQVYGGHQATHDELLNSAKEYSFQFALVGGTLSGIYGLCTNHTVTTVVGNTWLYTSSFTSVFWIGLGVSWAIGVAVGLAVAVASSESEVKA